MPDRPIAEWRAALLRDRNFRSDEVREMERRLRASIDTLRAAGLDDDEAFLIAARRLGVSKDSSETPWLKGAAVAVALAVAAAVAIRLPELFGVRLDGSDTADTFYLRNLPFFVLPFLAAWFAWERKLSAVDTVRLALPFVAGLLVMNLYPFATPGDTLVLAALHLPFALWLAVGFAFCDGHWRDHEQRLDFVRFSGEWLIHYALIALGGGVTMAIAVLIFEAIGLDAEPLIARWVLPCGAAGAVIIAAWLAEWRRGVAGNLAPVLTVLFTPLFTLLLLAFLGTAVFTGNGVRVERDVLIGFDLLLVLVVALFLYSNTARDPERAPGAFDALQLTLIVCALLADALAMAAILARISEFGITPNRLAALGLNVMLVANLGRAALLHGRFLAGRGGFEPVLRWQTACLPVYAAWAALVVVVFPLAFRFA